MDLAITITATYLNLIIMVNVASAVSVSECLLLDFFFLYMYCWIFIYSTTNITRIAETFMNICGKTRQPGVVLVGLTQNLNPPIFE